MKRYIYIILAVISLVACEKNDINKIWEQLRDHEERIQKLEALCNKLNSNIEAMQAVLTALEQNDYVTDVVKVVENGIEVGYSITFAKGGTVTIYHGSNGADGAAPKVSIRKAADGEYYWTADGEWMTDDEGNMIPASVPEDFDAEYITPQFRVADGKWYVSVDNGNTWKEFEVESSSGITSVTQNGKFVYLALYDGTVITIPYGTPTEEIYASEYDVIPGNVDPDKMAKLLADASADKKTIRFNDGTYIFSSTINVPSNVSLVGNTKTVFKPASETTPTTLMNIEGSDNVFISHITIDGGLTSKPAEEGNQIGLSVVSCRSINIENVEFVGWSKQGLYSKTMSSYGEEGDGKFFKHFQITNCRFYFNYCGNYFDYRCEYTQMLNCVWGENYKGTVNCGGNNAYVSCQWNANHTGFKMENSGSNPAHGGCNGCTFNHNDNQAIQVDDCVNGWTFEGCQIFYGKIVLNKSKGVIFNGNIWGSCKFFSTFPGEKNVNMITNTYFQTDRNVILSGNDGSTKVVNCIPEEDITDTTPDGSNILAGKILVTIGDSITYGADMNMESNGLIENPGPNEGKYKSYGWQIAQRNNMIFYQKGISGSTMQGAVNPNGTDKGDISKKNGFSKENGRYTQLPDDIDFMTIMFGWNDAAYGTLGTINDTTNETYYGGFNVVLPYLIHKYPYTTIVLIVPFGTTTAHRQAVRDMAQKWGVGCFDMCANDLPFYYSEESDDVAVNEAIKKLRIELNQVNGAHPGYQGHYAIGTRLEDYLRKCGCYDRENAVFYTVSYYTEHGTAPKPVEKVKVLYSTLFPTLTADGYIFKGWYMDSEFKTKATAGKVLNSDTTLYAKWESASGSNEDINNSKGEW